MLTEHCHDPDTAIVIRDTGPRSASTAPRGLARLEVLLKSGDVAVLAVAAPTRLGRGPRNWRVLIETVDRDVQSAMWLAAHAHRAPRRGI